MLARSASAACVLCVLGAWGLQSSLERGLPSMEGQPAAPRAACSGIGENCSATGCCRDAAMTCFRKHESWAGCKTECVPGIDLDDPEAARSPWSCEPRDTTRPGRPEPASQVHRPPPAHASPPEIEMYVINMDQRVDRCKCMQQRLAGLPHPVFRQRAVPHTACLPELHVAGGAGGGRGRTAEMSLFCSTYKLWQRALSRNETAAEFIMILEDDVEISGMLLELAPRLMRRCNETNYIVFDPFFKPEWNKDHAPSRWNEDHVQGHCMNGALGERSQLYMPNRAASQFWGTAATVVRKSYLPTLVERALKTGMTALDQWWVYIADNTTFAVECPGATCARQGSAGCPRSVGSSDIAALELHGRTALRCPGDQ